MKSIQLNKKQREKVVELIKLYFPKYKYVRIKPTSIYGYDAGMVSMFRSRWSLRGCVMHWYEMLTTRLLTQANNQWNDDSIIIRDCPDDEHLVDFLYRKFYFNNK